MGKSLPLLAFLLLTFVHSPADDPTVTPPSDSATKPPTKDSAAGLKVLAPSNDVGMGSDGVAKDESSYQVRIGELYAPGGEAYILPFCLPKLRDGQHFQNVHLRTQLVGLSNEGKSLANADLYGLGVRDTSKALPADYYQGDAVDHKATLLQAKFLTSDSKVRTDALTGPFTETSAEGDAALTKFLNDSYADGKNAGKYVFLRVSYDATTIPDGNNAYLLLTSGADGEKEPPVLTYTSGTDAKN